MVELMLTLSLYGDFGIIFRGIINEPVNKLNHIFSEFCLNWSDRYFFSMLFDSNINVIEDQDAGAQN